MAKKKRYSTALDVDLDILRLRKQADKEMKKAASVDTQADSDRTKANDERLSDGERKYWIDEMNRNRTKASKIRKHAHFLTDRKIPALGRTKAQLQTTAMPFLTDKSVVEEQV